MTARPHLDPSRVAQQNKQTFRPELAPDQVEEDPDEQEEEDSDREEEPNPRDIKEEKATDNKHNDNKESDTDSATSSSSASSSASAKPPQTKKYRKQEKLELEQIKEEKQEELDDSETGSAWQNEEEEAQAQLILEAMQREGPQFPTRISQVITLSKIHSSSFWSRIHFRIKNLEPIWKMKVWLALYANEEKEAERLARCYTTYVAEFLARHFSMFGIHPNPKAAPLASPKFWMAQTHGAFSINKEAKKVKTDRRLVLTKEAEAWQILHITPGKQTGEIDESLSRCNFQIYLPTPLAAYFLKEIKRRIHDGKRYSFTDPTVLLNWGTPGAEDLPAPVSRSGAKEDVSKAFSLEFKELLPWRITYDTISNLRIPYLHDADFDFTFKDIVQDGFRLNIHPQFWAQMNRIPSYAAINFDLSWCADSTLLKATYSNTTHLFQAVDRWERLPIDEVFSLIGDISSLKSQTDFIVQKPFKGDHKILIALKSRLKDARGDPEAIDGVLSSHGLLTLTEHLHKTGPKFGTTARKRTGEIESTQHSPRTVQIKTTHPGHASSSSSLRRTEESSEASSWQPSWRSSWQHTAHPTPLPLSHIGTTLNIEPALKVDKSGNGVQGGKDSKAKNRRTTAHGNLKTIGMAGAVRTGSVLPWSHLGNFCLYSLCTPYYKNCGKSNTFKILKKITAKPRTGRRPLMEITNNWQNWNSKNW